MVNVLTKYNPRVLGVGPCSLHPAERGPCHGRVSGGMYYTLSLEGLSGMDCRTLHGWTSGVGGRLDISTNGGRRSARVYIDEEALRCLYPDTGRDAPVREDVLDAVGETISRYHRESFSITHSRGTLRLGRKTCVMGIINVTPDSFYDGGRYVDPGKAAARARQLAGEGAGIIDIGGVSTRPGSRPVSQDEELRRIIPVIKEVSGHTDVPISVDTYRAGVAYKALEAGAQIINDISGLGDRDMARVAAACGAPVIIMHLRGRPHRMPKKPVYENIMGEITRFLRERVDAAVSAGVGESNIIVDPGIGFGKSPEQSLKVLHRLDELRSLGLPVMVGTSNKSFIRGVLAPLYGDGAPGAGDMLSGTLATVAAAIWNGARIVRVHEVREAVSLAAVCDAVIGEYAGERPTGRSGSAAGGRETAPEADVRYRRRANRSGTRLRMHSE